MSEKTSISWTNATWNPVTGCTKISPGCDNCYAEALTNRYHGPGAFDKIVLHPERLEQPLHWKQPRRIFVNSMSDLFHKDIPREFLSRVWNTMMLADWHCYQILTKRPHRAEWLITSLGLDLPRHIWLGVSVENQTFADNRIPVLLRIPAKVRFLSCEPLLESLDLRRFLYWRDLDAVPVEIRRTRLYLANGVNWIIDGGESGPNRRPANPQWFRDIRDQCRAAGVAYFHKQGNAFKPGQDRLLDGRTWEQYPVEARHGT